MPRGNDPGLCALGRSFSAPLCRAATSRNAGSAGRLVHGAWGPKARAGTAHAHAVRNGIAGQDAEDSLLGGGTLPRGRSPKPNEPCPPLTRIDPRDPFAVMLLTHETAAPTILHSARDANRATIAFHAEKQWLMQRRVAGDLLLMQQQKARTLLREPLP